MYVKSFIAAVIVVSVDFKGKVYPLIYHDDPEG
jgi:hypothetical protein